MQLFTLVRYRFSVPLRGHCMSAKVLVADVFNHVHELKHIYDETAPLNQLHLKNYFLNLEVQYLRHGSNNFAKMVHMLHPLKYQLDEAKRFDLGMNEYQKIDYFIISPQKPSLDFLLSTLRCSNVGSELARTKYSKKSRLV